MAAENVVMRIVVEDDGKTPAAGGAPSQPSTQSSTPIERRTLSSRPSDTRIPAADRPDTGTDNERHWKRVIQRFTGLNDDLYNLIRQSVNRPAAQATQSSTARPAAQSMTSSDTVRIPSMANTVSNRTAPTEAMPAVRQLPSVLPASPTGAAASGGISPGLIAAGVVAGVVLADLAIRKVGESVRGAITRTADLGKSVAGNDTSATITKATEAIGDFASIVPVAGTAVGQLVKTFGTASAAILDTSKAFIARAGEIAKYSPQISAAQARNEVREIRADMREASRLGDSYAGLMDAYGRLDNTLREMLLPIKEWIINKLAAFLDMANKSLAVFDNFSEAVITSLNGLYQVMFDLVSGNVAKALKDIGDAVTNINAIMKRNEKKNDEPAEDLMDWFLRTANNQPAKIRQVQNDAIQKAADNRLNIPAFAGL